MKIIVPMSGLGSRFIKAGYALPKPLIRVDGKPIIEHVTDMFPCEEDVLFICNRDHIENTNMEEVLKKLKPKGKIVAIDSHKKGPVFAVGQVFGEIKDDESVMVSYCDYGQFWDYEQFKKNVTEMDCAGAVPSYTGFHPHLLHKNLYAGVLTDDKGMMTDIKEKHCFTDNPEDSFHSGGSYYFKSGALVKKYFKELMDEDINLNDEYYVSMVYYLLKRDGLDVFIPKVQHFMQWGTPEDLEEYEAWSQLIHNDTQKAKEITDIPENRKNFVNVPYKKDVPEFEKSYKYWKDYFTKRWSM